jgi:hypothetical protein
MHEEGVDFGQVVFFTERLRLSTCVKVQGGQHVGDHSLLLVKTQFNYWVSCWVGL